jgi:NADH-quinone oxidoreductase subunit J
MLLVFITLGAALLLVTRRNLFHAALFMILSFFGVAGLYVLLEAPFLAAAQLFIYVVGIAILIIFVIVLTREIRNPQVVGHNSQWLAAFVVTVALCGALIWTVIRHDWGAAPDPVPAESLMTLGQMLVAPDGLALPFELAAVLLMTAIVGAVTIVRER